MNSFLKKFFAAAIPLCLSAGVVHASNVATLNIKKQTSHYMNMGKQIKTIAVGDPSIATPVQVPGSAHEFLIVAKNVPGSTTLFVWTVDGARYEYLIRVSPEDPDLAKMIEEAINLPDVHVKYVDGRVLLTGTVQNQYEKNYVLQTARLYVNANSESSLLVGSGFDMKLDTSSAQDASSGRDEDVELAKSEASGEIIDLLQILRPTQIRLEAQVIVLNSDDAKELGIQYGTSPINSPGIFYAGEDYLRSSVENPRSFRNNPAKWVGQHFSSINAQISALITKDKAKILSRPSITTLSGEQATIQIGGEIPYSTTSNNGTNTQFKNYGVILQFKPVVDAQNRISAAIHAEVSTLSDQYVGEQPMIDTRSADSVISLFSGSPIVIGGLMNSEEYKRVTKVPLLGDIPILGEFFKHTSKSRDKRELIIVVTPYLVEADEISHAPMTQPMREWYEQEERLRREMQSHDFKEPEPEVVIEEETEKILPPPNYSRTTDAPFK